MENYGNVNENDYSLTDFMILVKGSTYTEDDIRSKLTDLFKVKLPFIPRGVSETVSQLLLLSLVFCGTVNM